jgi:hypothetical protein
MAKYSKGAGKKVEKAMHEMKHGQLKSGRSGKKVKSREQAIAIGLSEARERGEKVPKKAGSKRGGRKSAAKKGASKKSASRRGPSKKAASKGGRAASKKSASKRGRKSASKKSASKRGRPAKRGR